MALSHLRIKCPKNSQQIISCDGVKPGHSEAFQTRLVLCKKLNVLPHQYQELVKYASIHDRFETIYGVKPLKAYSLDVSYELKRNGNHYWIAPSRDMDNFPIAVELTGDYSQGRAYENLYRGFPNGSLSVELTCR